MALPGAGGGPASGFEDLATPTCPAFKSWASFPAGPPILRFRLLRNQATGPGKGCRGVGRGGQRNAWSIKHLHLMFSLDSYSSWAKSAVHLLSINFSLPSFLLTFILLSNLPMVTPLVNSRQVCLTHPGPGFPTAPLCPQEQTTCSGPGRNRAAGGSMPPGFPPHLASWRFSDCG